MTNRTAINWTNGYDVVASIGFDDGDVLVIADADRSAYLIAIVDLAGSTIDADGTETRERGPVAEIVETVEPADDRTAYVDALRIAVEFAAVRTPNER